MIRGGIFYCTWLHRQIYKVEESTDGNLNVTHNRQNRDDEYLLFDKYGTGNYRSFSCKTSLGVMMGLEKKSTKVIKM